MMEQVDLAIVGGGMAGLSCAAHVRVEGAARVCLLEKNAAPGKKLLLSGTGQCNLTNATGTHDFLTRYGDHGRFVKPALLEVPNTALVRFFEECGLPLETFDGGKIFPRSRCAADVLAVLRQQCQDNGVLLRTDTAVRSIERADGGFRLLCGNGFVVRAAKVVLATGGTSYPTTGSSGDGYALAAALGHRIVPPRPALAPVELDDYRFVDSAGFAVYGTDVHLFRDNKKVRTGSGDVLFTHKGLSGPGILNLSRFIEPGDTLRFSLLPRFRTGKELEHVFKQEFATFGRQKLKTRLAHLGLPERLVTALLKTPGFPAGIADTSCAYVEKTTRKALARAVAEAEFVVKNVGGFPIAMCTAGGIALDEVRPKTMESRLVPSLFFCGEVLDVDGDCGGFNLQFAFSSGVLAAKATKTAKL